MNKKTTGIVAYITFIGLIVAFCAGDKEGAKFHLNQALVIVLAQLAMSVVSFALGFVPIVGGIIATVISLFLFICWLLGLISAIKEEEKEVPLLGQIKILK